MRTIQSVPVAFNIKKKKGQTTIDVKKGPLNNHLADALTREKNVWHVARRGISRGWVGALPWKTCRRWMQSAPHHFISVRSASTIISAIKRKQGLILRSSSWMPSPTAGTVTSIGSRVDSPVRSPWPLGWIQGPKWILYHNTYLMRLLSL